MHFLLALLALAFSGVFGQASVAWHDGGSEFSLLTSAFAVMLLGACIHSLHLYGLFAAKSFPEHRM